MRKLPALVALLSSALIVAGPAGAQTTGMMNGSANTSTTKAVCSPGDPNVMVNMKAKTYAMDTAAIAKAKSAKNGQAMAAMSAPAASTSEGESSASTMKSMCKSEAVSMGAKMAPAPSH